jgi:hypothetical protein
MTRLTNAARRITAYDQNGLSFEVEVFCRCMLRDTYGNVYVPEPKADASVRRADFEGCCEADPENPHQSFKILGFKDASCHDDIVTVRRDDFLRAGGLR